MNYYGIEDVKFIWHGEWSDPEVSYGNKIINEVDLLENFIYNYEESTGKEWDFSADCVKFMLDNADEVRYYISEYGEEF